MRVGVLLHWNEGEESGVFKKVVSQITTWKDYGVHVSFHVISRYPMLTIWQSHLKEVPITLHRYSGLVSRLRAWKSAVEAIKAQHPDLVYHRYDLYMPALKSLFRKFPVVLEINTNDLTEYCLTKGLRCWYNLTTRSWLLSQAAGLVFMTYELSRFPCFSRYRKPSAVIPNGIDLRDFRPLPRAENNTPKLVFLGTGEQVWQGVDKILRMAEIFPRWQFEIVGIRPSRLRVNQKNVRVHGPLPRQAYEPLLAQADIAIGTLALHRKKLNEACPLKTREYLAYGLPVIIGYKDSDFINGAPFILELPNTEDNVESRVSEITNFVSKWKGQRVPREAISHLDLLSKESQRLAFFRNILKG